MKDNEVKNYLRLTITLILSTGIMYLVMYLNCASGSHVYFSLTRLYMSLLMVSPMALLMLGMMKMMYKNKKLNSFVAVFSVTVFILSLVFLRTQTPIDDKEYMKAMIPHHSSAIMTSENAHLKDPEVKALADSIIASQREEIAKMKTILERMDD